MTGKNSKISWQAMFFLYMMFAMNANGREITNRLSPYIIDTFNVNATQIGLIGTISAIGMIIGCIPLARWVENGKHGAGMKKRVTIVSSGYLLFMLLCGFSPICSTFAMLLILQGCRGAFSSAGENGEVCTVVEWWPKEKNGFALGFHHTAYPWGTLLGGFLVSGVLALVGEQHWQLTFLIFPIIGAFVLFGFNKFSTQERYDRLENEIEKNGMTPALKSMGGAEATSESKRVPIKDVVKVPEVWTTCIMGFCCQFSYIGLMFWMPLYLAYVAGYDYASVARLSVLYAITGGLGQIFWGRFADKHGVVRTLAICFMWLAIAFVLMQYINKGMVWLVGLQLLIGCCSNAVYPVMYKRVQDAVPDNANVSANSVLTTIIFVGAALATTATGWLIQLGGGFESISGYNVGLYGMAGLMLLAFIVLMISEAVKRRKAKQVEE